MDSETHPTKKSYHEPVCRIEYWFTEPQLDILFHNQNVRGLVRKMNKKILEQEEQIYKLKKLQKVSVKNIKQHQEMYSQIKTCEQNIKRIIEYTTPRLKEMMVEDEKRRRYSQKKLEQIQEQVMDELKQFVLGEVIEFAPFQTCIQHQAIIAELKRKFQHIDKEYSELHRKYTTTNEPDTKLHLKQEMEQYEKEMKSTIRDIQFNKDQVKTTQDKLMKYIQHNLHRVLKDIKQYIQHKELILFIIEHDRQIYDTIVRDFHTLLEELSKQLHGFYTIKQDMSSLKKDIVNNLSQLNQVYSKLYIIPADVKKETKQLIHELYSNTDFEKKITPSISKYIRDHMVIV